MIDTRTRLLAVAGSLVLLLLIVDLVRRRRLKEEYSFLWVVSAVGLLILAGWFELLQWLTHAIGGVAPSSTIFFFALLFVFFMLLHFSVRVSTLERRLTALVQELGLLTLMPAPQPEALPPPAAAIDSVGEPPRARVAVVIPCFNDGALLEEAVGSVREEEPVEIVVVDDGSTDAQTIERLGRLEERDGVRVAWREQGGPGAARMTGMAATSAPLVFPLDADDRLEPGALATLADALERAPHAAFAWGDYGLFGDHGGYYRSPDRWLPWTLTYVNPYPISSMFRREPLQRAGGWQMRAYEDWDLWLRMAGLGLRGIRVDRVVYRRRLHGASRRLGQDRRRHAELYEEIRRRNPQVFEGRAALRAQERPALWKQAAYPVFFGARKVLPYSVEAWLQRMMMRLGTGLPG